VENCPKDNGLKHHYLVMEKKKELCGEGTTDKASLFQLRRFIYEAGASDLTPPIRLCAAAPTTHYSLRPLGA